MCGLSPQWPELLLLTLKQLFAHPPQTAPKRDARICRTAAAAADYCIRTFMCVLRGSNKDGKAEA
jgi:hypothetical protein